jgi:regulator of sigma E protease
MAMVLYFLIVLGFAVTLHELGHFLVAKWSGVRVERFSLGFGPKLVGFRRGGTEYVIAPIPFGGYVKMAGDSPEEGAGDRPGDFLAASPWRRIGIVLAGPGMNFFLGFVIFYSIALFPGVPELRTVRVAGVESDSLAGKAGIQSGDRVIDVGGERVESWSDFAGAVSETIKARQDELPLRVQRGGEVHSLTLDLRPLGEHYPATVGYVSPDGAAASAGVAAGWRVLRVEGEPVGTWNEMAEILGERYVEDEDGGFRGLPTEMVWEIPEGDERTLTIVPEVETRGKVRSVFGIARFHFFEAEKYLDYTWPGIQDLGVRAWIKPIVGEVKKGSPAWEKGIRRGDLVMAFNGEPVDHWYQMAGKIYGSYHRVSDSAEKGEDEEGGEIVADPVTLTWVKPDGTHHTETIQPEAEWIPDKQGKRLDYAIIGIGPRMDRSRKSILGSAGYAFKKVRDYSFLFVYVLKGVISGAISPKAIGGPIAIAQISGERGAWGWESLFNLIAMLSVSFAVINLVPIPVLDGGHFLVYLIEGIRRKRLTLRQMELVQKLGLAILIPIIGLVFYNDLSRYIPFERIADIFRNLF